MTGKHTPGPWVVFLDDSGGEWTGWPLSIDATSITDKTVVRTGGQWPYKWDAKTSQAEAVANAHLIAASPDLLELVELIAAIPVSDDMADDVPIFGLNGVYITCGNVRTARAAIAKARGQE